MKYCTMYLTNSNLIEINNFKNYCKLLSSESAYFGGVISGYFTEEDLITLKLKYSDLHIFSDGQDYEKSKE